MQLEQLTRLLLNDDEMAALYEVCVSALENNLLDGYPLAFAMAIVETFKELDDDDLTVKELNEEESITLN